MPRAGRQLEVLTAEIGKALSPAPVTISSPYIVPDKDTGQARETDVGIIGSLGSTQLLVIVECREREGAQDVTWIEQLSAKRASMSAAKAVAVSVDGFTGPARTKAKALNIELREMKELKQDDIADWCKAIGARLTVRRALLGNTKATVEIRKGQAPPPTTSFKGDQLRKAFMHTLHPAGLSYMDFWQSISKRDPVWNSVPEDGKHHSKEVDIVFGKSEAWYWSDGNHKFLLKTLRIEAQLWKEAIFAPWSKFSGYDSETGRLAESAQATIRVEGKDITVGLLRAKDGRISTSIAGLDPNLTWDIAVKKVF